MAAIDFPASPTVGQLFTAGNGVTYKWSGVMWLPIGGASMLSIGDTPPPSPGNGPLWWTSTRAEMFLYSDGTASQWVLSTRSATAAAWIRRCPSRPARWRPARRSCLPGDTHSRRLPRATST